MVRIVVDFWWVYSATGCCVLFVHHSLACRPVGATIPGSSPFFLPSALSAATTASMHEYGKQAAAVGSLFIKTMVMYEGPLGCEPFCSSVDHLHQHCCRTCL
jgi:hypothetical protein